MMSNVAHLQKELETFEANKDQLVADSSGKWVVIHADEIAGVWDTYEDALKSAYEKYGLEPFLVKQILAVEQTQFISRRS